MSQSSVSTPWSGNAEPHGESAEVALARRLGRLGISGNKDHWAERYVVCEQLAEPAGATSRQRFEAISRFIRDLIAHRWLRTRRTRSLAASKRVHYLSMEFLLGRTLRNNIMNLMVEPLVREALQQQGWDLDGLYEQEPDAGLGNGGLGRLAACFVESLATLQYPAIGYGLRYEYGMFKQTIRQGSQTERPDNWLLHPDPWEVVRAERVYAVPLAARFELRGSALHLVPHRPSTLLGVAYDRPIVGYGAQCINTLRLWAAAAPESFDFAEFSHGDFAGAVIDNVTAESLTRVLYPDDSTEAGRSLRFLQQYFMVSCSLQDIAARFTRDGGSDWTKLPQAIAIQMNDTHPALCVAELMRILLDSARLSWDEAWQITLHCLAYTNHTLLPEALEQWPISSFEALIPRHLEIIYEINRHFLDDVRKRFPGDEALVQRVSLIEEGGIRRVRMAHLAVVGSHSTNGVSAIHSELLRTRVLRDFAELYPERFSNKTNGVTPRRWLQQANPYLSKLITEAVGDGWVLNMSRLEQLRELAQDRGFAERFRSAKRQAKAAFADWLRSKHGQLVDPDSIFDCQIKRIHEYKRQLLNILHVIVLYNRIRSGTEVPRTPHTFLFAGKAAPAYTFAKLIIKLINSVGERIANEPLVRDHLKVIFLPDYNVSLAEQLIPATDVSEQISTAGFEASGTGNMKFMMNGALTIGTRDGATIEMAGAAGEENFFLFGLTAAEVIGSEGWYDPRWHYEREPETRAALDLIHAEHFSEHEPGIFGPIRRALLEGGDRYRHLADLQDYSRQHRQVDACFADAAEWTRRAICNVAASGRFSSDRTISEYAQQIWNLEMSPVQVSELLSQPKAGKA